MILLIGGCGYIGSHLFRALETQGHNVHSVDLEWRGNPAAIPNVKLDYGSLTEEFLADYDVIILLAGHSSVAAAQLDPSAAFENNVVSFRRLLDSLSEHQRLFYASSSSIYSGFGAMGATEDPSTYANMYDLCKYVGDALAGLSGRCYYALRFGTVNGPSANTRSDLMLNKMVNSALDEGEVRIQNPRIHRPILGIRDLGRAVMAMLDGDGEPGIYNLASFNSTVFELGATVANELRVQMVTGPDTPAYDFEIITTKFEKTYDFQFEDTAISIVRDLMDARRGRNG